MSPGGSVTSGGSQKPYKKFFLHSAFTLLKSHFLYFSFYSLTLSHTGLCYTLVCTHYYTITTLLCCKFQVHFSVFTSLFLMYNHIFTVQKKCCLQYFGLFHTCFVPLTVWSVVTPVTISMLCVHSICPQRGSEYFDGARSPFS